MKKIIYIAILTVITGLSLVSCTEDNVEPNTQNTSSGGAANEEERK